MFVAKVTPIKIYSEIAYTIALQSSRKMKSTEWLLGFNVLNLCEWQQASSQSFGGMEFARYGFDILKVVVPLAF